MFVIFAGPTISDDEILNVLPAADIRPPAATGDILSALTKSIAGIGLIDGYFDGVPSVWHKEILWAIDSGIPVFGSSSMGALRAAELSVFGMIGAGRIYEDYQFGEIEDDDEVAIRHGPAELGYPALSEPMVNFRATVNHAIETDVISTATGLQILNFIKSKFYPERRWEALSELRTVDDIDKNQLTAFLEWQADNRIDQKKVDAVTMLEMMREYDPEISKRTPYFEFQHTVMWEDLLRQYSPHPQIVPTDLLIDLLRLTPERYQSLRVSVSDKLPETELSDEILLELDHLLKSELRHFREKHGIFTSAALQKWMSDEGLDETGLRDLLVLQINRGYQISSNLEAYREALIDIVRSSGEFSQLIVDSERGMEILSGTNMTHSSAEALGLSFSQLQLWYFETLLKRPVPKDIDLYLRDLDIFAPEEYEQMLARLHILWQHGELG